MFGFDIAVDCEFTLDGVEGNFQLFFDYTYDHGAPVNLSGHPDAWCEAEGDNWEFDHIQVELSDGYMVSLDPKYHDAVSESLKAAMDKDMELQKQDYEGL